MKNNVQKSDWRAVFLVVFGAVPVCINIWMYEAAPEKFEGGTAMLVSVFQIALSAGAFIGGLSVDYAGLTPTLMLSSLLVLGASVVLKFSHSTHSIPNSINET